MSISINFSNPMIARAYELSLGAISDAKKFTPKEKTQILADAIESLEFDLAYALQADFSENGLQTAFTEWLASLAKIRAYYASQPQIAFMDTNEDQRGFDYFAQKMIAKTLIDLATSASDLILEMHAISGELYESAAPDDYADDLIYEFIIEATNNTADQFEYIRNHEILSIYFEQTAEDLARLASAGERNQLAIDTMIGAIIGWPEDQTETDPCADIWRS